MEGKADGTLGRGGGVLPLPLSARLSGSGCTLLVDQVLCPSPLLIQP